MWRTGRPVIAVGFSQNREPRLRRGSRTRDEAPAVSEPLGLHSRCSGPGEHGVAQTPKRVDHELAVQSAAAVRSQSGLRGDGTAGMNEVHNCKARGDAPGAENQLSVSTPVRLNQDYPPGWSPGSRCGPALPPPIGSRGQCPKESAGALHASDEGRGPVSNHMAERGHHRLGRAQPMRPLPFTRRPLMTHSASQVPNDCRLSTMPTRAD